MSAPVSGNLLKATKGIIWFILVLLGIAAAALLIASAVLPFVWDEVLIELAKKKPEVETQGLLPGLYAIFAIGLVILGLTWTILRKLLAIVGTVSEGDPFVRANAARLKAIGWLMVAGQVLGFPLYAAASEVVEKFGKRDLDGELPIVGILSILLVFVLAGVFEQGAAMREEMEGTV